MKGEIKYKDVSASLELKPEEIKYFIPSFLKFIFNREKETIKFYSNFAKALKECQEKNGWKNFLGDKLYLKEDKICNYLRQMPFFIKQRVKNRFIDFYIINCYEASNRFFAAMEIFFKYLKKKDLIKIYIKHKDNDQANLWPFLEVVENKKPRLLSKELKVYLGFKQKEWADLCNRNEGSD